MMIWNCFTMIDRLIHDTINVYRMYSHIIKLIDSFLPYFLSVHDKTRYNALKAGPALK